MVQKIPGFTSRVLPPRAPANSIRLAALPGQAVAGIGDKLTQTLVAERKRQDQLTAIKDNSTAAAFGADIGVMRTNLGLEAETEGEADGLVDRTLKSFDDEAQRRLAALENRPELREKASQKIKQNRAALEANVFRTEHARRTTAINDDLDASLDSLAIAAMRNPAGVEARRAEGLEAIDNIGIAAGIPAERLDVRKAVFNNNIYKATIESLIESDPVGALAKLDAGEFDQFITDPDTLSGLFKSAERAVDRAKAEKESLARPAVLDAITVLENGKEPADLAQVRTLAEGTIYEPLLQAAVEDRAALAEFIELSVPEQAGQIKQFVDKATSNRREVELQNRMARRHAIVRQGLERGEGLSLAAEADAISDLNTLSFDDPVSLRARAAKADMASEWAGRPVSPLTPDESDGLAEAVSLAPPAQVVGLLNALHEGFGRDQALVLAGEFAPKNPEIAMAIALGKDTPFVARDIVIGGRLLRENKDVKPSRDARIATVELVTGDMFTPETAGALNSFVEAASALYAARQVPTGDQTYDEDAFELALRDVMGGPIEFNGRTILPPVPGMVDDDVEAAVESLTDEALLENGNGTPMFADGTAFSVENFSRGIFRTDAQLVTSGFGTYLVFMPGLGFVVTEDGGGYELNLRRFIEATP